MHAGEPDGDREQRPRQPADVDDADRQHGGWDRHQDPRKQLGSPAGLARLAPSPRPARGPITSARLIDPAAMPSMRWDVVSLPAQAAAGRGVDVEAISGLQSAAGARRTRPGTARTPRA